MLRGDQTAHVDPGIHQGIHPSREIRGHRGEVRQQTGPSPTDECGIGEQEIEPRDRV